jgi:WD40 repeat protein
MIFTFYSFKGGVGRSMALAAVANVLAKRGLNILVVDFDLEAPGLERYFFDEERSRTQREQPGLIDLVLTYKRALTNEEEFKKAEFKNWQKFKFTAIHIASSCGGKVDIMSAGARATEKQMQEYAHNVRDFDWQDFFYNWKGGDFFEWLRRQWINPKSDGETEYDAVLIDSRTGVTELGGVCTYQLADTAVLLCAPNYQNLGGTRTVLDDFRSNGVNALRQGRALQLLVVPTRVDHNNPHIDEFLTHFERVIPRSEGLPKILADAKLDYRSLAIPYQPEFAVGDRLVGGESNPTMSEPRLVAAYEKLADALTLLAQPNTTLGKQQKPITARLMGTEFTEDINTPQELVADTTRSSAGYDVFISASPNDFSDADKLRTVLEASGQRVFMDQAEVTAGENFPHQINEVLEYSATLFFCLGAEAPGKWRELVLFTARKFGRINLVPVLFAQSNPETLRHLALDEQQAIDLRIWPENSELQALLHSRQHIEHGGSSSHNRLFPYPGPAPYSEDLCRFFAGREQEIQQVYAALVKSPLVVLHGAAKIGKTSLVLAGLLPLLRDQIGVKCSPPILLDALAHNGLELDSDIAHELSKSKGEPPEIPRYVLIDNADSFPVDAAQATITQRMHAIAQLLDYASPGCHILLVWRDAFPDAERNSLNEKIASHAPEYCSLEKLAGPALEHAIEEPAKRAGHLLEPGLAERIIEKVGISKNAVVYIQNILQALWAERSRGWLTNKKLDALLNLQLNFSYQVKTCLEQLNPSDITAARILFNSLIRTNANLKLITVSLPWTEVASIPALQAASSHRLRDQLVELGLLDLWRDQDDILRLALVRTKAKDYLDSVQDTPDFPFYIWRSELTTYLVRWQNNIEDPEALLSGSALSEAEQWYAKKRDVLTASETDLIIKSQAAYEGKLAREKKRQAELAKVKNLKFLAFTLVVILATLASSVFYYLKNQEQIKQTVVLRLHVDGLAVIARTASGNNTQAISQLLAAYRMAPSLLTQNGLIQALRVTASLQRIFETNTEVTSVAFSPDGTRLLSGSSDNTLRLWDTKTGKQIGEPLQGHTAAVTSVAFSPDGTRLLSGSDDMTLRLWNADTGLSIGKPLEGHISKVTAVAFSPDGTLLLSSSRGKVLRLWDAKTRQPIEEPLQGHTAAVTSIAFSPDGKLLLSGSDDMTLRLWDIKAGKQIGEPLQGHTAAVTSVAFSPDGTRLLSGSSDNSLRLWNTKTGKQIGEPLQGHTAAITSVAFNHDSTRLLSGSDDMTLRLWEANTGKQIGEPLQGHTAAVIFVTFSPTNATQLVSGSNDNTLRFWDQPTGEPLIGHTDAVTSVAFSPDGTQLLSGSDDKTLGLWNVKTRQLIGKLLKGHDDWVTSVAFSPDGKLLLSGSDDMTLRLWNPDTHKQVGEPLKGHKARVTSVAFSPDGARLLSGSSDMTLRLWNTDNHMQIGEPLKGHTARITSVAFSPDGTRLLSGSGDTTLRLWDAKTGKQMGEPLRGHTSEITSVAFSPDGTLLLSGSRNRVLRLWDAKTGKQIGGPLRGHTSAVTSVAFSPDGTLLLSGSRGRALRLWDANTRQPIGEPLEGHKEAVTSVVFSPDGKQLLSGSGDNTLRLWPLPDTWDELLCQKLTRNMSKKQWDAWVSPDIDYVKQCPDLPIAQDE